MRSLPLIAIALLLALAPQAAAQQPHRGETGAYAASSAALWGTALADIDSTSRGIATGHFHEANGALANSDGSANYKAKLALNGAIQGLSLFTFLSGHRRIAIAMNCTGAGVQGWAAWHNKRAVDAYLAHPAPAPLLTIRF